MGNKNSGLKKYDIPFDLEKEESMYWLGYICADGNIYINKNTRNYTVSLFSKDKEIIDKFSLFMGNRTKYHLRKQNGIHQAYICSKQLCNYLELLNITPNKSLVLNPYLPLNNHFIRGYFDGDGSIRKNKKECKITSGSKIFIKRLSIYLDNLGVFYKIRKKGNAFDICIERAKDTEFFLNHIYNKATIYLERKYKQFDALFGNKKEKNSVNSGKIQVDNPEPSSLNSIKVNEKVQRLTVEELTNNTDTSAEQPKYWLDFKEWKTLRNWYKNHPLNNIGHFGLV